MPFVSRTRATLRSAEFGFFGVAVYTRVQTPRRCGAARRRLRPCPDLRPGVATFFFGLTRPLRTSWLMLGMAAPTLARRFWRTAVLRAGSRLLLRRGERHRERVLLLVRRQAVLALGRDAARRAAAREVAVDLELHARRRSGGELREDDLTEVPVRVHGDAVGLDDVRGATALAALAVVADLRAEALDLQPRGVALLDDLERDGDVLARLARVAARADRGERNRRGGQESRDHRSR